ncbi:HTH domain-containing protein [Halorientalis marina]|uniref:HTH domain-containing protein n=1 Tax=Halorientalis marina TaxID=2931976 RepID=UPI001FF295CD|nr:HTH domain-containing protein [Halorientalis marina]
MTGNGISEGVRVELYARSSLPTVATRRRESVENRLEETVEEGHIETIETETYRKKVPLDEPSPERALYERFEEWASDVGVSLDPFFDTRECYSMDTGERGQRLVLPALCIAIYRNDRLQTVYPHSTPQGSRTVLDCLNAIETVETDPRAFETDDVDTREEDPIEAE